MEEDHQILGAGGPLGQCFRKLISNPQASSNWVPGSPGLPVKLRGLPQR